MVATAKALENKELKFYDDLNAAKADMGHADLLFSSSTLSYVPDPYAVLAKLVDCGASNIFLTRLPLTHFGQDIVHIQKSRLSANGPGPLPPQMADREVRYPMTAVQKQKVEDILRTRYDIQLAFVEKKDVFWLLGQGLHEYGYFATKR